jgi:hypothetical protein
LRRLELHNFAALDPVEQPGILEVQIDGGFACKVFSALIQGDPRRADALLEFPANLLGGSLKKRI